MNNQNNNEHMDKEKKVLVGLPQTFCTVLMIGPRQLNTGNSVDVAYLDFHKAFDKEKGATGAHLLQNRHQIGCRGTYK